jgi:hypothetical protein
VGVSALSLLLPTPANAEVAEYYSPSGTWVSLIDAFLAIGAGILFLMAVRNFKPELKSAYQWLAVAALMLGVLTLGTPYIEYYGLWSDVTWNTFSYLSYFFGGLFMYLGMRLFYRQLEIGKRAASLAIAGGATLAIWLAYIFIPHIDDWVGVGSELKYDLLQLLVIWPVVGFGLALYMAARTWHTIGHEYKRAFGWLLLALAFMTATAVSVAVMQITGYDNWYFNSRFYELPYILGDFALLIAGYHFVAAGLPLAEIAHRKQIGQEVSSMAIITYVARLSAKPDKLDTYLEPMRRISAKLQPGEQPSIEDQVVLKNVYLQIERQLVEGDALRTFTPDVLRHEISQRFALDEFANKTFWPLLHNK